MNINKYTINLTISCSIKGLIVILSLIVKIIQKNSIIFNAIKIISIVIIILIQPIKFLINRG